MDLKAVKRGNATTVQEAALRNLGVSSTEEINAWFRRSYAGAYRIDGIEEGIDLLLGRKWDLVRIIGDYDVDGTSATAIARLTLRFFGYPVEDRIPRRFSEGFGLNPSIVEEIRQPGNVLLITVDNGIAALDAVRLAKEKGYFVIITDHHLPVLSENGPELPDADVIIDPNAVPGSADYNGYCGAGLIYRFMSRLIDRRSAGLPETELKKLTNLKRVLEPLAMMGTIADAAELREENYVIARNGLNKLEKRCATPGMLALHDRLWVTKPTASDIGFKSGPCINANGRLFDNGAAKSVDLLSCMDYHQGVALAEEAIANNNIRKQQVTEGLRKAEALIREYGFENDLPLVLYLPDINEGIVGIIAGRLQEEYRTAVCVLTDSSEPGILKGSGRSPENIHLKNLLDRFSDLFVRYGGHAGAAGMSIRKDDLDRFRAEANAWTVSEGLVREDAGTLLYDLEITASDVPAVLDETLKYGPFGHGNEAILFKVTGFRLKEENGIKKLPVGENGVKLFSDSCQAIGFGLRKRLLASTAEVLTLYGTLSYNYFRGEAIPQIEYTEIEEG